MWSKSAAWCVRTPWPAELADWHAQSGAMARSGNVRDNLGG